MRTFKFLSVALILTVGMFFTFNSCQKEEYSNNNNNNRPPLNSKTRFVNGKDIYNLVQKIKQKNISFLSNKDGTTTLNLEKILEVQEDNGYTSYTFKINNLYRFDSLFHSSNLIVTTDSIGNVVNDFILDYAVNEKDMFDFIFQNKNLNDFNGIISLYSTYDYSYNINELNNKSKSTKDYNDPCSTVSVGASNGGSNEGVNWSNPESYSGGGGGGMAMMAYLCWEMWYSDSPYNIMIESPRYFMIKNNLGISLLNLSFSKSDPCAGIVASTYGLLSFNQNDISNYLSAIGIENYNLSTLNWILNNENTFNQLVDLLYQNNYSIESINLVQQAITLKNTDIINNIILWTNENENIEESIIASTLTLTAINNNILTSGYTPEIADLLNQNANVNFVDPTYYAYFSANCAILKLQNPTWPDYKVYWEATREMIHLALDIGGLVPVVGEVCDLTNGLIYAIEGDGVNASLSTASAIPFAGWFTTGAKFAYKGALKFVVKADGFIDFGTSSQLRKILGITSNALQAHHIMPWALRNHDVVQKAAKSGNAFHMNDALNGIAVASWRNQPNHNVYNNLINAKLDALPTNLSPSQAYNELVNILNQAKQAIINNPNTHLNNLNF